jgi:glycosyltransferase involved in cell wall biosynthesis
MQKGVLIIVENLPVPFDRRVWQEACTLNEAGYNVSIICPKGKGYSESFQVIDDIEIFRHSLPFEADRILGYVGEYLWALCAQIYLTLRICLTRKKHILHACNPPDNIFIIGIFFRLFGKKFVFDHHDICPELFDVKFGNKGLAYKLSVFLERCSFAVANISIATNESYARIAVTRGRMKRENVFIVRSGPDLRRVRRVPENSDLKCGRSHLVAYVGVMGKQEGLDLLLESVRYIVNQMRRRDIQFALVGGGTELETLKDYAKELEVEPYVTFFGRVPDDQLLEVLSTAEVCVNSDRVNEMNSMSTMNKILEYMALGKAIVQYDLFEGRVSAGDSSLYASPNDANDFARKVVELIDNPEMRERMGAVGRLRIEESLSWHHQSKKLLEAYSALYE